MDLSGYLNILEISKFINKMDKQDIHIIVFMVYQ